MLYPSQQQCPSPRRSSNSSSGSGGRTICFDVLWCCCVILLFSRITLPMVVVDSYIFETPTRTTSTTMTTKTTVLSFAQKRNRRRSTTRIYESNDDDDMDSVDRDMGRIGWGKTVLSEALLGTTTSNNDEYVFPEFNNSESTATAVDPSKVVIGIALTREEGKNDALTSAIQSCAQLMQEQQYSVQLQTYELPCIQHTDGPDYDTMKDILYQQATDRNSTIMYDYVVVTSPEAARVLASVWPWTSSDVDGTTIVSNPPKVAAVGKATEVALRDAEIDVSFVPTKATAQTLVKELPPLSFDNGDRTTQVLYPASVKAANVIVNGLEERTVFSVTRMDTYDTIPAVWDTAQQTLAQQHCQIVCFASPSAIKGWIANTQLDNENNPNAYVAACIGETSAAACRKLGWEERRIFYPKEQPGMEGWVEAIMEAAATIAADTTTYVESVVSATTTTTTATPPTTATK